MLNKKGEQLTLQVWYEMQALGQDINLESLLKAVYILALRYNKSKLLIFK